MTLFQYLIDATTIIGAISTVGTAISFILKTLFFRSSGPSSSSSATQEKAPRKLINNPQLATIATFGSVLCYIPLGVFVYLYTYVSPTAGTNYINGLAGYIILGVILYLGGTIGEKIFKLKQYGWMTVLLLSIFPVFLVPIPALAVLYAIWGDTKAAA